MTYSTTVIIPAYIPDEKYLSLLYRAMTSLACQTYTYFKVILVLNDCSPDIQDKMRCFVECMPFDTLIIIKDDRTGPGDCMILAEKHVDTKYICRLDADDQYAVNKLDIQYTFMESNPDVDFSFTSYMSCSHWREEPWGPDHDKMNHQDNETLHKLIPIENIVCGASFMAKTETVRSIGGFERQPGREDWDMWLKAIRRGCVLRKIPRRLYIYTRDTSLPRRG